MELVAAYRLWFGYRIANYDHRVVDILQRHLHRETHRTHARHTKMDTLCVCGVVYRFRHILAHSYSFPRYIVFLLTWHLHVLDLNSLLYGTTAVP